LIGDCFDVLGVRMLPFKAIHQRYAGLLSAFGHRRARTFAFCFRRKFRTDNRIDPSIGIMHGNRHNKMPLVSDLMESMRPLVDQQILKFALSQTFHPCDFTINRLGGCRLNPQMAKVVASRLATLSAEQAVNGFLGQL
jgi:hypothetical protein